MLLFLKVKMFSNRCLQNKTENLRTEWNPFMVCVQLWTLDPTKHISRPNSLFAASPTWIGLSVPVSFPSLLLHMPFVLPAPHQASQLLPVCQTSSKLSLLWEVCPRCPPAPSSAKFLVLPLLSYSFSWGPAPWRVLCSTCLFARLVRLFSLLPVITSVFLMCTSLPNPSVHALWPRYVSSSSYRARRRAVTQ